MNIVPAAVWSVFLVLMLVVLPVHARKASYLDKLELGDALVVNGRIDGAIRAYEAVSFLKPDAYEPHMNLIDLYRQKDLAGRHARYQLACRLRLRLAE